MFAKQQETALADLSTDLSDETDWRVGTLRTFDFPLNLSTVAVEPLAGLIALGIA
jgi:syntaxin-binding protein 5